VNEVRQRRFGPFTATDVVVATLVVGWGQLDAWGHLSDGPWHGPRGMNAFVAALAGGAVLWRRTAPLTALCWVGVVVVVTRLVFAHDMSVYEGYLPVIVLNASAPFYRPTRVALRGLLIAEVVLIGTYLVEPSLWYPSKAPFDNLFFLIAPWVAAFALRATMGRAQRLGAELSRVQHEQAAREAAVVVEERARLARELHDVVAHSVSVMVVNVGAARLQLADVDSAATAPLLVAEDAGRQALTELRRLLGLLRLAPDSRGVDVAETTAPQPALDALDGLVARVRSSGLTVDVVHRGDVRPLSSSLELSAYRIVQEALTNTLKHAGPAAAAAITLDYGPDALTIDVVDDGGSSPVVRRLPASGHGLLGAKERAGMFGGSAAAGPTAAGGWRVHACLPVAGTPGAPRTAPVATGRALNAYCDRTP
jgi:signal transduction histidine kinase